MSTKNIMISALFGSFLLTLDLPRVKSTYRGQKWGCQWLELRSLMNCISKASIIF